MIRLDYGDNCCSNNLYFYYTVRSMVKIHKMGMLPKGNMELSFIVSKKSQLNIKLISGIVIYHNKKEVYRVTKKLPEWYDN